MLKNDALNATLVTNNATQLLHLYRLVSNVHVGKDDAALFTPIRIAGNTYHDALC